MTTLAVRGDRVVLPDGIAPAVVVVRDGRIAAVDRYDNLPAGLPVVEAGDHLVLPGLVDTHVHINEPGRDDWEGFVTATGAAAAGGVTTLVDMPLNSIPSTTTVAALEAKRAAARERVQVDVGFWGGVVPGNRPDLEPLVRAGVLGFKCFLCPSGVDEFAHVGEDDLRAAMPVLARLDRPLLAHAEDPAALHAAAASADPRRYQTWIETRPEESEQRAIELLVRLSAEFGTRVHIVHLASSAALPALRKARADGHHVTVETCPHYLTFAAEEIADGATLFKCAPPIRSAGNRERLWRGLLDGEIDLIATDHSPAPPALKGIDSGSFLASWGGIASLQLGLAAVWTGAVARGIGIDRVIAWMASGPARLAGLWPRKGGIATGADADLVIWDSDATWTVDAAALFHRHPITAYAGRQLRGRVVTTMLGGEVVFANDELVRPGRGRLL